MANDTIDSDLMPADVLRELASAIGLIAGRVAARIVAERSSESVPRYASAKQNPLGNARAFREAAAAGAFKTFRRGKKTAALWSEVEAWMMAQPAPVRRRYGQPLTSPAKSLSDELAMASRPARAKRAA